MSERIGHYGHEVQGAIWSSWERQLVYLTDGNGNYEGGTCSPENPAVQAFLERGGRIEEPGTPEEELAWVKERKIDQITGYADERLEQNEPEWSRSARLAQIALRSTTLSYGISVDLIEADTRFDAQTLGLAAHYIRLVMEMTSVDAVRDLDPTLMAWPKFT